MSDAPERVWLHHADQITHDGTTALVYTTPAPIKFQASQAEYIRADRITALEAEAREAHLQSIASMGQAAEAHAAQLKAEAERDAAQARAEKAEAEVERLLEALIPSGDTKVAYMGEIECDHPANGRESHHVPWTSIKQIMAMIRARATLSQIGDTDHG